MNKKYKICAVATKGVTIKWFMLENLKHLADNGFEVHIVCNEYDALSNVDLGDLKLIPSDMQWGNVNPKEVLKQVRILYKLFKQEKYDIIQFASFNASLYSAIAGWLARVPVRINCQWGISYPIYTGWQYYFRKFITILLCKLSTNVQPDSKSNLQFSIENHLYPAKKGNIIYNGSACGVNLKRYDISQKDKWKKELREKYSIPEDVMVYGYVGRIEPEKGLNELFRAYLNMDKKNNVLFIVGSEYGIERMNQDLYKRAKNESKIIFTGPVNDVERYDAFFDFLILPSWQEGFGLVIIEAAAVGTPAIITNIKGPRDVVTDGVNGFLCDVKSSESLQKTMERASLMSREDYETMSKTSYEIARRDFDSELFKQYFLEDRLHWISEYKNNH